MSDSRSVFVTGGTGYIGTRLIVALLARGHTVRAIARTGGMSRLPRECSAIEGDVLDAAQLAQALRAGDTLVHLVGTSHPSPAKAPLFRAVDLASAKASVDAAVRAGVSHMAYVSVAHPAPVMHAYIAARVEAEAYLSTSGIPHTVLRPWYVLGPGHQWPHLLRPLYHMAKYLPAWRETARRLGLVTVREMVGALVWSVEHGPAAGIPRVLDVPDIRARGRATFEDAISRES